MIDILIQRHGLWTKQNVVPNLDENRNEDQPQQLVVTSTDRSVEDTDSKPSRKVSILSVVAIKQSFRRSFRGSKKKKKDEDLTDSASAADTGDEAGRLDGQETMYIKLHSYFTLHYRYNLTLPYLSSLGPVAHQAAV